MYDALSTLATFGWMYFYGTWLLRFVLSYEPPFAGRLRFICALSCAVLHAGKLAFAVTAHGRVFSAVSVLVWLGLAWLAYVRWWNAAPMLSALAEPPTPTPQSPAARLDEIRGERLKLDAEERELLKRPDAHRP